MTTLNKFYWLALVSYFLQFVLLIADTFTGKTAQLDSIQQIFVGLFFAVLIKGLPWLVLIPGLIMKTKNIMAWMSYVCLVYFIVWILGAFGEDPHSIGLLGVFTTIVQFVASAMYTRLSKRLPATDNKSLKK